MERTEDIMHHAEMVATLDDVAEQGVESAAHNEVEEVASKEGAENSPATSFTSTETPSTTGEIVPEMADEMSQAEEPHIGEEFDDENEGDFDGELDDGGSDGEVNDEGKDNIDSEFDEVFAQSEQQGIEQLGWMDKLEKNNSGESEETLKNCELIFENDQALIGLFGKNLFTERTELIKNPPWKRPWSTQAVKDPGKSALWQSDSAVPEFQNSDLSELHVYMSRKYDFNKQKYIDEAVDMFSARNCFHPVRDYLESLQWDGEPRVDTLISDYFGVQQSDYLRGVTRKTLIAGVKRVYEPGCQFDYALTLYGPQGCGKTSFWANLGGRWYTEMPVNIGTKDALQTFQGAWLVEMGELAALSSVSVEKYKSVLTRRVDRYRKHFEKLIESHPRQCVIVGTTNRPDFLRDWTGNRRFWIVDVTSKAKPKKSVWTDLPKEADQIWAEAKHLYDMGAEQLFLDGKLAEEAEKIQKSFMSYDPMRDAIEEYLARLLPTNWRSMTPHQHVEWLKNPSNVGTVKRTTVCLKEILYEALGETDAKPGRKVLNEIAATVTTICNASGERWHRPVKSKRITGYEKQKYFELY